MGMGGCRSASDWAVLTIRAKAAESAGNEGLGVLPGIIPIVEAAISRGMCLWQAFRSAQIAEDGGHECPPYASGKGAQS